jgi:hypothetical protein
LLLLGMWLGGGLAVLLILHKRQDEAATVRWVVAGGALAIGAALWWSQPLRAGEALLFAPACVGLAVGLLRPLSYLWQAPLSLGLAFAARLGAAPLRLLPLHPASYDDLCLLPLPGLSGLLVRSCITDLEAGGEWLLRIAQHPGQRRAVEWAIDRTVRQGRLTHPLLFWLSTSDEGIAVLRVMVGRERQPHALISAYAAFAQTIIPDSWPAVLEQHQAALTRAVALPGGQAVLALLDTGAGALRADRWPDAIARLGAALALHGVAPDPIWDALASIRAWAGDAAPAEVTDRAAAVRSLVRELDALEGWPVDLIAAMCEHLLFLISIERRRGAWLV